MSIVPSPHSTPDASGKTWIVRSIATAACGFVVTSLALLLVAPRQSGTWDSAFTSGGRAQITHVAADSPLAKAGIRVGDTILFERMPPAQRVAVTFPVAGVPATMLVERGSATFVVTATPSKSPLAVSPSFVLTWLLTALYAGMALLVAWRASPGRPRSLIVAILGALCVGYAAANISRKLPSPEVGVLFQSFGDICIVVFLVATILFVVSFPPRRTTLVRYVTLVGIPLCILSAIVFLGERINSNYRIFSGNLQRADDVLMIVAALAIIVGVIDGLVNASAEYRVQARVAGSTILVLSAVNIMYGFAAIFHFAVPDESLGLLQWAAGFGVAYAVLRHRLVDLNLVVSRAAIFSAVSLSLIAMFVVAEWALATILERAIGPAFGEGERTALAAVVALGVGLSARAIHLVIEHRLNRLFFAKRYRALADLHRFALETDSTTDATALLELTLNALRRNCDAQYVALYTGTPERGYVAVGTTAGPHLPLRFDQNEENVLRLRRWGESFAVEHESHPLHGALMSPMMLRGTLHGFAICGPKRDRTSYLPEEEEAVTALIHRVGIAFEWLTRPLSDVHAT